VLSGTRDCGISPLSPIKLTTGVSRHGSLLEESTNVGLAYSAIVASATCCQGFGKSHRRELVGSLPAEAGGFNRHAVSDLESRNAGSSSDDYAGRLMT
jgi:hypothetical protein